VTEDNRNKWKKKHPITAPTKNWRLSG
jgi:hypothetical protein